MRLAQLMGKNKKKTKEEKQQQQQRGPAFSEWLQMNHLSLPITTAFHFAYEE